MNFLTATHTDVGIKKKTNQDSIIIQQAQTEYGNVILAAVCDGMGGLAKGEVASAVMVHALKNWFLTEFPGLLAGGLQLDHLRESWENLVFDTNHKITNYGIQNNIGLGTTCCVFLAVEASYYIMNVGDSRVYLISDQVYQLTRDQTVVQREIDMGRMTYEEAMNSPQRSVLLQCVGASDRIEPDFFQGNLEPEQCVMICSDGFRHVITPYELYQYLNPAVSTDRAAMEEHLTYLTELNKQRNETDNISALLIKIN